MNRATKSGSILNRVFRRGSLNIWYLNRELRLGERASQPTTNLEPRGEEAWRCYLKDCEKVRVVGEGVWWELENIKSQKTPGDTVSSGQLLWNQILCVQGKAVASFLNRKQSDLIYSLKRYQWNRIEKQETNQYLTVESRILNMREKLFSINGVGKARYSNAKEWN